MKVCSLNDILAKSINCNVWRMGDAGVTPTYAISYTSSGVQRRLALNKHPTFLSVCSNNYCGPFVISKLVSRL